MPLTEQQLQLLQTAFRPHGPIEFRASFCGRDTEIGLVQEALSEPGLQLVVYGEMGCGKTSLVNVATEGFKRVKVFCEESSDFDRLMRDTVTAFQEIDPERLVYDAARDTIVSGGVTIPLARMNGNNLMRLLPAEPTCVIFDELDRVKDEGAIALLAELCKNVATNRPDITFVMIGVAGTADALLQGHSSNHRNIRYVHLVRMGEPELRDILAHGETVLNIKFSEDVSIEMLELCDNMPYYLHLLAKNAAKAALGINSPIVELDDLARGIVEAAGEADQQLRYTYDIAVEPKRRSLSGQVMVVLQSWMPAIANKIGEKDAQANIYQRIVWAIASLPRKDSSIADITLQANKIEIDQSDGQLSGRAVAAALKRLASSNRGCIVFQSSTGFFCFTNPLMKGFVRFVRYGK